MHKYVLKRLGLMVLTFVVIFLMVFVLIKLVPPDPLVGTQTQIDLMEAERIARGYTYTWEPHPVTGVLVKVEHRPPIMKELGAYLKMVFTRGNFGLGEKMYTARSVGEIFTQKLPFSLYINIVSVLIAVPLGLLLGILAALRKNKLSDHVISTVVMIGVSVPVVVLAPLLQYYVCFKLNLLPITLAPGTGGAMYTWTFFRSALPGIMVLSLLSMASLARFSRAELTEVLTSDFMLLARTKGLTKWQATSRHALKNAMVVVFPMILGEVIGIFGGSIITEGAFSIPGIGNLYLESIRVLDYNFFFMMSVYYVLIALIAGLIIDLSYQFIDPRIRMGAVR